MKSVLFVCQTNLVCSPLAAALAKQRFDTNQLILFGSAGVFAGNGNRKYDRRIAEVAIRNGVPFPQEAVQGLSKSMLKNWNVVFYLDEESHFHLNNFLPEPAPRMYMLSEFSEEYKNHPVPDPLQLPVSFEETFNMVKKLVESLDPVLHSSDL